MHITVLRPNVTLDLSARTEDTETYTANMAFVLTIWRPCAVDCWWVVNWTYLAVCRLRIHLAAVVYVCTICLQSPSYRVLSNQRLIKVCLSPVVSKTWMQSHASFK